MGRLRRALIVLATAGTLLLPTSIALGDGPKPTDKERAGALKKDGDAAMDTLRYDDALRLYTESFTVFPDPAILYNRGRVYGARGEYQEAIADLERFGREAPPDLRAKVPHLMDLIAEMRSHLATVTVKCNEAGARVVIRDRVVGTTPLEAPVQVTAGSAKIEVAKDGFRSYQDERDLPGGKTTALTVDLVRLDAKGVLTVRASSGAATVSIDGQPVGSTPLEVRLDPGEHRLSARADGFEPTDTAVVVADGEHKTLDLTLRAKPSVLSRWWFWTAIGAGLVAGGAVTYALVTERKPGSGDNFAPSRVSGPLRVSW